MKRIVFVSLFVLLLFVLPVSVFAQDEAVAPFAGIYNTAYEADGDDYAAMLVIRENEGNYRLVWIYRDGGVAVGIGVPIGENKLAGGYNESIDPVCGIHVAQRGDDGALTGVWKQSFEWGGEMTMTPADAQKASVVGDFSLRVTSVAGDLLTGTASITEVGTSVYNILWDFTGVPDAEGIGVMVDDYLVFSLTTPRQPGGDPYCGIEVFTLSEDGSISGEWVDFGDTETSSESPVLMN